MKDGAIITFSGHHGIPSGSSRIRAYSLLPHWAECEAYRIGASYPEFLIFQKVKWPEMARAYRGLKIYDICDPIWLDAPDALETLSLCDGVVAATDAIRQELVGMGFAMPMATIGDHVDPGYGKPKEDYGGGALENVVWFGFHHTHYLLSPFVPTLRRRGIRLHVISDQPYAHADANYPFHEATFPVIATACDAAIFPDYAEADPLNQRLKFKSTNKRDQAWAWGLPVIEEAAHLDTFDDPALREQEGKAAREQMLGQQAVVHAVEEWRGFIRRLGALTEK